MQRSKGGSAGFTNLFPHPVHLEMFPEISHKLKGSFSFGEDDIGDVVLYVQGLKLRLELLKELKVPADLGNAT